jgi:hypothetical protein
LSLLPGNRGWNYAARELERPVPLLLSLASLVLLLACAKYCQPVVGSLLVPTA